jgi:hypothetical protein
MTTGAGRRVGGAENIDDQDAVSHDHLLDGQVGQSKDGRKDTQGFDSRAQKSAGTTSEVYPRPV